MNKFFLHISASERISFARHLSIMIKTGMTLVDSLKLIQKQKKSRSFTYILTQLIAGVENGQFMSVSLLPFKDVFGELFINVVKVGEASGSLAENLGHLASELQKRRELFQKIHSALIYPAIVFVAMLGVISLLVFFVLPKIIPIFNSMNVKLL